jgi:hypothetical protein
MRLLLRMQAREPVMVAARTASADMAARVGQSRALPKSHGALSWLERQALSVTCLATLAGLLLRMAPSHFNQDTWLALVDGRYVVQHGIPRADSLAVLTSGTRWIDQQWLAQVAV